jgi:hypothetical protein
MSARKSQEFISTVRKKLGDLKAKMKAENSKLAKSIKTVSKEMTIKKKTANKNLSKKKKKKI